VRTLAKGETGSMDQRLPLKKSVTFMIIGFLIFIIYLYFFVGFEELSEVLENVNLTEYFLHYSLAVVAIILNIFFYAMTWHELLKILSIDVGVRKAFLYCWLGSFVDEVVPLETVTGEITRVYLAHRDLRNHVGELVASVTVHRILTSFVVLSGLTASSLFLIFTSNVEQYVLNLLILVLSGTAALVLFLFFLSAKEERAKKLVLMVIRIAETIFGKRLRQAGLSDKAQRAISIFHHGMRIFGKQPTKLLKPVIYTFSAWFSHMIVYHLVFYALGFSEISLSVSIVIFSISTALQTIPIGLPVGPLEIVMTSLYTMFNIPIATSGAATTLIRTITFWFKTIVGYVLFQWIGIKNIPTLPDMKGA